MHTCILETGYARHGPKRSGLAEMVVSKEQKVYEERRILVGQCLPVPAIAINSLLYNLVHGCRLIFRFIERKINFERIWLEFVK